MKDDMQTLFNSVRSKVKVSAILPSIGNNDVVVHNNVPCDDTFALQYYSDIFNIWFPNNSLPLNFDYVNSQQSFLSGGYYRYDFPKS
jgi:hypothetical protein